MSHHTPNPRDMDINSLIAALEGAETGANHLRAVNAELLKALQRLFNCVPLSVTCADASEKIVTSVGYWRGAFYEARATIMKTLQKTPDITRTEKTYPTFYRLARLNGRKVKSEATNGAIYQQWKSHDPQCKHDAPHGRHI